MDHYVTINGLPRNLRQDTWWFSADLDVNLPVPPNRSEGWQTGRFGRGKLVALVLVLLGDWLFWDNDVGVSLALFLFALNISAFLLILPRHNTNKIFAISVSVTILSVLPLIEYVNLLSVTVALIGVVGHAIWLANLKLKFAHHYGAMLWGFVAKGLVLAPVEAIKGLQVYSDNKSVRARFAMHTKNWALALTIGCCFVLLLSFANPFLEQLISSLFSAPAPSSEHLLRFVFWAFLAYLIWPFLNLHALGHTTRHLPGEAKPVRPNALINAVSIQNALLLFNAIFGVQLLLDGMYLWGGATLPEGMTYAEYAHRGAYPLLFSSLLAGIFVLMTQPFQTQKTIRVLVYTWIGQNLMLTYAAIFRLKLYVDAYALTYMRVTAFIWMALVLLGLSLIILQMIHRRDFSWLVRWNGVAVLSTLYICCFVNFASFIAHYNIEQDTRNYRSIDSYYICSLGPHALPAILEYENRTDTLLCDSGSPRFRPAKNWRDWGYRDGRIERYLTQQQIFD